jgi:hypothetical protein
MYDANEGREWPSEGWGLRSDQDADVMPSTRCCGTIINTDS